MNTLKPSVFTLRKLFPCLVPNDPPVNEVQTPGRTGQTPSPFLLPRTNKMSFICQEIFHSRCIRPFKSCKESIITNSGGRWMGRITTSLHSVLLLDLQFFSFLSTFSLTFPLFLSPSLVSNVSNNSNSGLGRRQEGERWLNSVFIFLCLLSTSFTFTFTHSRLLPSIFTFTFPSLLSIFAFTFPPSSLPLLSLTIASFYIYFNLPFPLLHLYLQVPSILFKTPGSADHPLMLIIEHLLP